VKREHLEHLISAAATVSGEDEIVVIGSQALLAQFPTAPDTGFHEMNGYYAHGVAPETVRAPAGWRERLVRVEVDRVGRDRPAVGWCLEVHDLVASNCSRCSAAFLDAAEVGCALAAMGAVVDSNPGIVGFDHSRTAWWNV
jgi:hypothetical protein